ncbi:anthranilate synthase beta family protein [Salix suchowensis]|nr:anthranilate synthase beta family protein [Salix suchowensis]
MAAASMGRQTACNQSKLSLALKTQESSPLNLFSIPSRVSFGAKSEKGLVVKCSVVRIQFRVAASNDRGIKNPVIVIDNYDSFTYNLCQYMGGVVGCHFEVFGGFKKARIYCHPRGVLVSPGSEMKTIYMHVVSFYRNAPGFWNTPTDEKGGDGLFAGLSNPFTAGRYRSLVVEKESFPGEELEVTAWTEDGLIMAARHRKYKHLQGVQFHPESIVTSEGKTTVRNFIKMAERKEVRSKLILCNGKGHDGTINLLHLFKLLSELSILVSRVGLLECRQAGETQMNAFVRRGN